jgi:hypothetical protein
MRFEIKQERREYARRERNVGNRVSPYHTTTDRRKHRRREVKPCLNLVNMNYVEVYTV